MSGLNKVQIIGNVGSIETKEGKSGMKICNISIATSKKKKDNTFDTEWHKCVLFDKVAEIAERYVQKGHKLYVEGSLKTEKYQDKEGIERQSTKIIVNTIELLERRDDSQPQQNYRPAQQAYENKAIPFDDDIPF
jgi:single-strand DNA-binding protein